MAKKVIIGVLQDSAERENRKTIAREGQCYQTPRLFVLDIGAAGLCLAASFCLLCLRAATSIP